MSLSKKKLVNHLKNIIEQTTKQIEENKDKPELEKYYHGRRNALAQLKTDILAGVFEDEHTT